MKLYIKIIIAVGVLTIAGTAGYGYLEYGRIAARVYEAEKKVTAAYIQEKTSALLSADDFIGSADTSARTKKFEKFFDEVQTSALFRIKVWNNDFVVIWSNLPEIIGKRFPNNHEMREALDGKIEFELKIADKKEQVSERNYIDFSETYVPIKDAQGKVIGVIEAYQKIFKAQEAIKMEFQKFLPFVVLFALAGLTVFASIIYFIENKL